MRTLSRVCCLLWTTGLIAQSISADPAGVLSSYALARFTGSGTDSIQAMTSDAAGNVYVAGTTSSPDLALKDAFQPALGDAVLMRSLDRGATWQKIDIGRILPLTLAPHPSDPQTLLAGAADGIYKSIDGGGTWRQTYAWTLPNPSAASGIVAIVFDPANPRLAYAATNQAYNLLFLASADGGETWQPHSAPQLLVLPPATAKMLWVDPSGSGTVVLGFSISRDRGATWQAMAVPASSGIFTAPDPRHTGWLYGATARGASGAIFESMDWGASWIQKALPNPPFYVSNLVADPELTGTVYAVFSDLYVSNDAAATWHATTQPADGLVIPLSRQCSGGALFTTSAGNLFVSPDFGATWQQTPPAHVINLATGPGCAIYAVRTVASDAFVAKLSPSGETLWATFLGGMNADTASAIALDTKGNVFVAGNTASADFPSTRPLVGPRPGVFVVQFDPTGNLLYSTVLGGEGTDSANALAVDSQGNAYLTGRTSSRLFPTTAGAFQTQARNFLYNGFALKLGLDGSPVYASYITGVDSPYAPAGIPSAALNLPPVPIAIAAEMDGSALIGGYGSTLSRISPDGSSLAAAGAVPGQVYTMNTDASGNVYVAGQTTRPPLGSGSCFAGYYYHQAVYWQPGDTFVVKLQAGSLSQLYSARLSGACQTVPGSLQIAPSGEVTLGVWGALASRNPVMMGGSHSIARLSAEGTLLFSSTLNDIPLTAPPVAAGPDGLIYVGIRTATHAAVAGVPVPQTDIITVDAKDALSGYSLAAGSLMTIIGQNLSTVSLDLGLNDPDPLPLELGGVQVLFDGVPAQMFQVAPDHVICVVPPAAHDWVTAQVVSGDKQGAPFLVHVTPIPTTTLPNVPLLTRSFPALPGAADDGNIRNSDGTLNDAQHPAAMGSTVTLFATGLAAPGPITLTWSPAPPNPYSYNPASSYPATASVMPGFINVLYAISFQVPNTLSPGITDTPPPGSVTRVQVVGLNSVGIYVVGAGR